MRTTNHAARGGPLAALLLLLIVAASVVATAGDRIQVEQTLEWAQLEAGQTGLPETVDLDLVLRGVGPADGFPIDCLIIVDTSATAQLSTTKPFALDLIDQFDEDDRIGIITYSSSADLAVPLSKNHLALKTAIGDLKNGAKSALGDAMQIARRELTLNGRDDAVWVEILLSDGQSNVGIEPDVEGEIAAESGIRIISVGIGSLINRNLLESFADDTDGLYFARPSDDALAEIVEHLEINTAASEILITKQLPEGLRLVSSTPTAYRVTTSADGVTSAVWRVSDLRVDQELEFTLEIAASEVGAWSDDMDLMVTYKDFRGTEGSQIFPPPNWPPIAQFDYEPVAPTTAETISFTDLSEDTNSDGKIVKWAWEFGDEGVSSLRNPQFRFTERGTYIVRLTVTDDRGSESIAYERDIEVGNAAPVAGFVLRDPDTLAEYEQPHLGVLTMLDASRSYDLDGTIESYEWDFDGDGIVDLETDSSEAEHAFVTPGKQSIKLTVVDDEGKTASAKKSIDILPSVVAERTIDTGMPDDVTIPGGTVRVSITLSVNTTLNGLTVSETIPDGWTFAEEDNDGPSPHVNGQRREWLFDSEFLANGVDATRLIQYTLTAPDTITDDMIQASIHGVVGSSSPRVSLTISGDDRVTVTKVLPVPVAISRLDTATLTIDPFLGQTIEFDQIQRAISWWGTGDEVPDTGGAVIDLQMMQDLVAYWLTHSSVHDPLP